MVARISATPGAQRTPTRPSRKRRHTHDANAADTNVSDRHATQPAHTPFTPTTVATNARASTHVSETDPPPVNHAHVNHSHASNRHTAARATRPTPAPTAPGAIVRARRKVGSRCSGKGQFALRASALIGHEARPTNRFPPFNAPSRTRAAADCGHSRSGYDARSCASGPARSDRRLPPRAA